jgi:hypothetical protein
MAIHLKKISPEDHRGLGKTALHRGNVMHYNPKLRFDSFYRPAAKKRCAMVSAIARFFGDGPGEN